MIRTTITLAAVALPIAAQAATPDYPHRNWGQVATVDMEFDDAIACVVRAMGREGDVSPLSIDGGTEIDFRPRGLFGSSTFEPYLRIKLRNVGSDTIMHVYYRHPVTKKTAGKYVAKMQKRCLKVIKIEPLNE